MEGIIHAHSGGYNVYRHYTMHEKFIARRFREIAVAFLTMHYLEKGAR